MNTCPLDVELEDIGYGKYQRKALRAVYAASALCAMMLAVVAEQAKWLEPEQLTKSQLVFCCGAALGAAFTGFASSLKGRTWTFKYSLWGTISALLAAAVIPPTVSWLFLGAAASCEFIGAHVFGVEAVPSQPRKGLLQEMMMWASGVLSMSLIAYLAGSSALRLQCLVAAVVAMLCYIQRRSLEESLVFLYETGQFEEYHSALSTIHDQNGTYSLLEGFTSMNNSWDIEIHFRLTKELLAAIAPYAMLAGVVGSWVGTLCSAPEQTHREGQLALACALSLLAPWSQLSIRRQTLGGIIGIAALNLCLLNVSAEVAYVAKPVCWVASLSALIALAVLVLQSLSWESRAMGLSAVVICFVFGAFLGTWLLHLHPILIASAGVASAALAVYCCGKPDKKKEFHTA